MNFRFIRWPCGIAPMRMPQSRCTSKAQRNASSSPTKLSRQQALKTCQLQAQSCSSKKIWKSSRKSKRRMQATRQSKLKSSMLKTTIWTLSLRMQRGKLPALSKLRRSSKNWKMRHRRKSWSFRRPSRRKSPISDATSWLVRIRSPRLRISMIKKQRNRPKCK